MSHPSWTGAAALSAHALLVARSGRVVAGPLDFAVAAGEGLLLTGPNGSGKTTLLRTLAGYIAPGGGHLSPGEERGEMVHFVGHRDGVKSSLSLTDNLRFAAATLGGRADDAALTLAQVGLAALAEVRAGQLSAGQRRRLALARLLAAPRAIWLLDEPTTALDVGSRAAFEQIMAAHLGSGGIVVAATHVPFAMRFTHHLDLAA